MAKFVKATIPILLIVLLGIYFAGFARGGKEEEMKETGTVSSVVIPPIDASVPSTVETATFALG